jgi:hypothetical protein
MMLYTTHMYAMQADNIYLIGDLSLTGIDTGF